MSTTRQLAVAFLAGAAVAFAASSFVGPDTDLSFSRSAVVGQAELDEGGFKIFTSGTTTPTGFVWSRTVNGAQVETWALFRPTETDGWVFPGSNNTSVGLTIDYENTGSFTSVDDFLDWCTDQYPASMNVDTAEDFEVHDHEVSIR